MPRPSPLENPFEPEKHRSADDPKLVGKILGADAEAAMRKVVPSPSRRGLGEVGTDGLTITPEQQAQAAKERERREALRRVRPDLFAWAEEIGKDEWWVENTFTIHADGSLTVEGNLEISGNFNVTALPRGIKKIGGFLHMRSTGITSCEGFPEEIGRSVSVDGSSNLASLRGLPETVNSSLYLGDTAITSLDGLPKVIKKDLDLTNTRIASLEGLPPPENIGGTIYFAKTQEPLKVEAERLGYRVEFSP